MDEIEVTPILVKTQLGSSRASALDRRIQEKFLLQSPLLAERKTNKKNKKIKNQTLKIKVKGS